VEVYCVASFSGMVGYFVCSVDAIFNLVLV